MILPNQLTVYWDGNTRLYVIAGIQWKERVSLPTRSRVAFSQLFRQCTMSVSASLDYLRNTCLFSIRTWILNTYSQYLQWLLLSIVPCEVPFVPDELGRIISEVWLVRTKGPLWLSFFSNIRNFCGIFSLRRAACNILHNIATWRGVNALTR